MNIPDSLLYSIFLGVRINSVGQHNHYYVISPIPHYINSAKRDVHVHRNTL
jgi:hypothetical protein